MYKRAAESALVIMLRICHATDEQVDAIMRVCPDMKYTYTTGREEK